MHMLSQIRRLVYKIELRIQIDNKISCMTQINMSSRWTARIKVEDREVCFKRLRKRRLRRSKETDTGQNDGDPRVMESSILRSVIIWKMEVTCESKMDFILIWRKIQSR